MNNISRTGPFLEFGKIGRPHGLGGELRLFLHNPASDAVFSIKHIYLAAPGTLNPEHADKYTVSRVKNGGKFIILKLKQINGRNMADKLTGNLLYVDRADLEQPADDEFYVADLIGLQVFCDGELLGRIVSSSDRGGVEVVDVSDDDREIQIPLVDQYLLKLDIDSGVVHVKNIEGLPVFKIHGSNGEQT